MRISYLLCANRGSDVIVDINDLLIDDMSIKKSINVLLVSEKVVLLRPR